MDPSDAIELGRQAIWTALLIGSPVLLTGMVVGLLIGLLQALTQVQEQTVSFVPKIVVVMVAFVLFLPWMLSVVLRFVSPLLGGFDQLVR